MTPEEERCTFSKTWGSMDARKVSMWRRHLVFNRFLHVNRIDFDKHWLSEGDARPEYTKFIHRPVLEMEGTRDGVKPCLSAAVVDHHIHRARLADLLAELGHTATAKAIASNLPKSDRTRKGNFGEVIASEHLVQRHGYELPVLKLRFRDRPNLPMRGEDIVAFLRDGAGAITTVCIGEAKTLVRFTRQKVIEAHQRLVEAYRPRPETLHLIAEILYDRGDNNFGREVDRALQKLAAKTIEQENWIFMITDDQPADPFAPVQALSSVVPRLNCVNLRVQGLSQLVTEIFERPELIVLN